MSRNGTSYRAQLDYTGDRYGLQAEHLLVDARFDPQIGFVHRRDMRKDFAYFRFSPRTKASTRVRRYSMTGSFKNITNGAGRLETRTTDAQFESQFHSSDRFFVGYTDNHELLTLPFRIAAGVTLPVGAYRSAADASATALAGSATLIRRSISGLRRFL